MKIFMVRYAIIKKIKKFCIYHLLLVKGLL